MLYTNIHKLVIGVYCCMILYNIHAIMKTMCFPAHRSSGFVATHALEHINFSQRAFLETKAVLSFVRLLFLWT